MRVFDPSIALVPAVFFKRLGGFISVFAAFIARSRFFITAAMEGTASVFGIALLIGFIPIGTFFLEVGLVAVASWLSLVGSALL